MNPVIEELLSIIEDDPLPAVHTSSHWQQYGSSTIVERMGDELILRGSGFGIVQSRGTLLPSMARMVERLSYRRVTSGIRSHASVLRTAKGLARDLSYALTFNVWKQSVALAMLSDHWAASGLSPKIFALIGDGFGFLGALIRRRIPEARLYCIDLPKILVFQAHTHELADGRAALGLLSEESNRLAEITFVLPQNMGDIPDNIDCAINISSMQEMNEFSIGSYFAFLRKRSTPSSRFYCVNRLRKELPGGEVASFYDYPWQRNDEVYLDGPCPYFSHTINRRTLSNGPKWLGRRVPFINYFEGPMIHRLAHLAPD